MRQTKVALLVGILVLTFCMIGTVRYQSLQKQYLDRIRLDESLSMAAQDAMYAGMDVAEPEPVIYAEQIWSRFLVSSEIPVSCEEEWEYHLEKEKFVAAYEETRRPMAGTGYYGQAIGGAVCRKRPLLYVEKAEDGIHYYHRKDCGRLTGGKGYEVYYRMEECARNGAYPCPECILN